MPGNDLLVEEPPKKRGRPVEEKGGPCLKVQAEEQEPESTFAKMERAKLRTHESNAAFRELQAKRLTELMCNRATIEAESRAKAILIQRHLSSIPAIVRGKLVKIAVLTDGQLRAIERELEDRVPKHFRESMPSRMRAGSAMRDEIFVAIRPKFIPL
jgi:hypothetical protein